MALLIGAPAAYGQVDGEQEPPDSVIVHEVAEGETLYSISREYEVSLQQVRDWNDMDGYDIYIGQELIVGVVHNEVDVLEEAPDEPAEPAVEERTPEETVDEDPQQWPPVPDEYAVLPDLTLDIEAFREAEEPGEEELLQEDPEEEEEEMLPIEEDEEFAEERVYETTADDLDAYGWHEIEEGETLFSIAARYDLTVDTLRALNQPVPAFLSEGDSLRLPPTFAGYFHEVQEGETIADVAREYAVSIRGLQHVNNMETREVSPGQQMLIPGRPAPEPEPRGALPPVNFEGQVEVYPASFEGRLMAGGSQYDPAELTVSHRELPIGTVLLLTHPDTGASTFAKIADRGPPDDDIIMDISQAVADALGIEQEQAHVEVRVVEQ